MVEAALTALPPLRQELGIFPAPSAADGSPAWSLHDPSGNRFFLLTWPAFEILSRWHMGLVQAIIESVNRETTLKIGAEDIESLFSFLDGNFLLDMPGPQNTAKMTAYRQRLKDHWLKWLLKNYLFFRVPLVRPQRLLERLSPWMSWAFSPVFPMLIIFGAAVSLLILSRQWDVFLHSFTAYKSLEGLLILGCALPLTKVLHELGHALAAHRYGCKVPAMGLAFMVMTPMLYTDTNEAWKLTSRRQRLVIGSAGIMAELFLAVLATYAWIFLPEGPLRGAVFILATTTWIMTLMLNASPFMRFDGYFLLSDYTNVPNLHSRSFAFGLWWLRERLFGFKDAPPELASKGRQTFLIIFAFIVWFYRLSVFLGIALLVYHFFFKALGIMLFIVEVGWFILLPLAGEGAVWWKRRQDMRLNGPTIRTLAVLMIVLLMLAVPWQTRIKAPAVMSAALEQQVTAPMAGVVAGEYSGIHLNAANVGKGEVLVRLVSPDLEYQISRTQKSEAVARWQVRQQTLNEQLLSQGKVLNRRWEGTAAELTGLRDERGQLSLGAPFAGKVVFRNDNIMPGSWVAAKEKLYTIADMSRSRVETYVGEKDLGRIAKGAHARFIPDILEFGAMDCTVAGIDRVNVPFLEDHSLASLYGGPIPAQLDRQNEPIPIAPLFRVRLDNCAPPRVPPLRLRGVAHIDAERKSFVIEALRHAYFVVLRESGL